MIRQGPNGRRGPRRPHQGGGNGGSNNNNNSGRDNRSVGEQPRRSAAALRNQTFDSNGPEVRVRGNAWQVHEKYLSLARDAQMSGDRVAAENFFQHAEHYFRIIEAINEATAAEQAARGLGPQPDMRPVYQQQPTPSGIQPADATSTAQVATSPISGAMPEAEVTQTGKASPFFAPDEAEPEADSLRTAV